MKKILAVFLFLSTAVIAQQTINDLTVKDFKVVSTTKASKPCPVMTQAQRDAIVSPLNGQCVYNSTSLKLNTYNGSIWKASGGGVDNWVTATSYSINDVVIESSKLYQCLVAHTSGTFATDLAASKWVEISASSSAGLLTYIFSNVDSDIATYESMPSLNSFTAGSLTTVGATVTTTPTLIATFATNLGFPNTTKITEGVFTAHYETQKIAGANNYYTYFEVYKRTSGGVETLIGASDNTSQSAVNTIIQNTTTLTIPSVINILATDRIVVKIYGVMASSSATINVLYDNNTNSRLSFPISSVDATSFVPYIGATQSLNMGANSITAASATLNGNISAYNFDKENLLVNGNIENPLSSEWTCTVGTCTRTTTSGEFSKDTAALKVALSSQAMNVSQTITTPSGIQKQGYARAIYKVPSTMADFQICTIVDSAEQTCVPSSNLILDNTFRTFEIPLIFGSTNAGIKFKTTSAYTANAFFDGVVVAQGLGTSNLPLDNVYSAKVSSTGVVTEENADWISSDCTNASPAVCTFKTGIFTQAPTCVMTPSGNTAHVGSIQTLTSTNVTVQFSTDAKYAFKLVCQKSGIDYLASSSATYSQSSSNFGWTLYTSTITGFGTIGAQAIYYKRDGDSLYIIGSFTTGTPTATAAQMSLPSGLLADSFLAQSSSGAYVKSAVATVHGAPFIVTGGSNNLGFADPAVFGSGSTSPTSVTNGNAIAGVGEIIKVFAGPIRISGWTDSSTIVGSFSGYNYTPGATKIDTFSVAFGTGNISTDCTASPCFIDQIGTAALSVVRNSTGNYTLNTNRTYSKLRCTVSTSGYTVGSPSCNNCISVSFTTFNSSAVSTDRFGTLTCQGSY